ncbi:hypothetical protein Cfor_00419 [Coptotermes formosanus]|uniref:Ionotropic glutamate receptor C-terminal domain-containing protein n=1 Tax=Coptotermes formosanus TaxID=36987 RepID=A0A6L2PZY6_COPFO|nr:hypothetical protein Cfor_00419 [Coptotermes formosanus]
MAGVIFMYLLLLVYGNTDAKFLSADRGLPEHEYQMVRCFVNIISTHFNEERSLLISVPQVCGDQNRNTNSAATSTIYCEVTDFLFASIHSYKKYPLMITGPEFNDTYKNISHSEKATVCNIILGKGDEGTVFSAFKSELERLSHLPIWNARGRFIVMSLNSDLAQVSIVPEEHKLIRSVLGELWEKDVVNAVVLANSIDRNTSTATVDIHTWFPFTEDHCRGPVDKTVILDQCVINSASQFVKNAKLFPEKMSNFHRCELRASTFPHEPFVISNKKGDSNVTQYSEGIEISVLQTIANKLNFSVKYLPEPKRETHKLQGLYEEVSSNQSDVGFAAAPHTVNDTGKRDHTVGYVKETLKWFGPPAKRSPPWKGIVKVFTPLLCLLVLTVSLIFWLLANVNRSVKEHVSYKNALLCLLQAFSVVLGHSVFVRPHNWHLRLFFVIWVYCCLLINNAYQSSLISGLTRPQFEPAVDTVEKLLQSDMAYGYVPASEILFNRNPDRTSTQIVRNSDKCHTLKDCLKRIISTQDFAVFGGELHLLCLSYKKKYRISGGPKFIPFKDEFASYLATMFFRSGSPFLESFNTIIYRMVESGMVQKLRKNTSLYYHMEDTDHDGDDDEYGDPEVDGSDAVVLTLNHLQGAFILLLFGLALGLSVFIIELRYFSFRHFPFYQLFSPSVNEFKTRTLTENRSHVIHKTYVRRVMKRNLMAKAKRLP